MYSLVHKKENAHEDSIWSCTWGRIFENSNKSPKEGNSHEPEPPNDSYLDYIVTGGVDDLVKIWQVRNDRLELKHKLAGHSLGVISVDISAGKQMVASSSLDSSLRLWDINTGSQLIGLETGPVDVWTVVFSPDDKHVITGSNAKVTMYGIDSGKAEQVFDTRGKFILSIAYSPDGKYIATGNIDGIICIFDVAQAKLVHNLTEHAMPTRGLSFSPDSQFLLTASDDGHMKIFDVVHGTLTCTLSGHASWVISVAFSPDGTQFASCSSDKTVKIWDFNTKNCLYTFHEHLDQVWGIKYSPDSNRLVSVSDDKSINIYECPPITG